MNASPLSTLASPSDPGAASPGSGGTTLLPGALAASGVVARLLNQPILNHDGALLGFITIEESSELLVGRWLGHCTPETVVTGMSLALRLLSHYPCRAVLSDGSGATGDWSDLVPWMQYDMLPRLVEAGVQFIANVRSPDPAGRLAHQEYARHAAQHLTIRLFDEPQSAREWLRQELLASPAPRHPEAAGRTTKTGRTGRGQSAR